jgi:hypothetical protein
MKKNIVNIYAMFLVALASITTSKTQCYGPAGFSDILCTPFSAGFSAGKFTLNLGWYALKWTGGSLLENFGLTTQKFFNKSTSSLTTELNALVDNYGDKVCQKIKEAEGIFATDGIERKKDIDEINEVASLNAQRIANRTKLTEEFITGGIEDLTKKTNRVFDNISKARSELKAELLDDLQVLNDRHQGEEKAVQKISEKIKNIAGFIEHNLNDFMNIAVDQIISAQKTFHENRMKQIFECQEEISGLSGEILLLRTEQLGQGKDLKEIRDILAETRKREEEEKKKMSDIERKLMLYEISERRALVGQRGAALFSQEVGIALNNPAVRAIALSLWGNRLSLKDSNPLSDCQRNDKDVA